MLSNPILRPFRRVSVAALAAMVGLFTTPGGLAAQALRPVPGVLPSDGANRVSNVRPNVLPITVDGTPADSPAPVVATSDSAAVVATVLRYHAALESGDSLAALSLLAPDAVVLESGSLESLAEYRSHHLPSDIAFARAVKSERTPVRVVVEGDVAWVAQQSTAQGKFRDRAVDSAGAELMVLRRTVDGWTISAIHWSSRARR